MIRSIRPTDFLSLAAFTKNAWPNEAKTIHNLTKPGNTTLSWAAFIDQWLSLDENRHSWLSIQKGRIQGFISVKVHGSHSYWQIDRLFLPPESQSDTGMRLLEYISVVGGEIGVQKVFLRLSTDSPTADKARQAGFSPYQTEYLYQKRSSGKSISVDNDLVLRSPSAGDQQRNFQLYCNAVPTYIRQAEAMTLEEWLALTKKDCRGMSRREFVYETNGFTMGLVQIRTDGRICLLDMMVNPQADEKMESLLRFALAQVENRMLPFCLIPEHKVRFRRLVEEYGFEALGGYYSLLKQLTVRVRQPRFAPVGV